MPRGTASNRSDFDKLLAWIGRPGQEPGEVYEDIRARLMKMFYARGCRDAEELTDETIERVTHKVDFLIRSYDGNPRYYFYGVAKNVFREYTRQPKLSDLPIHLTQDQDNDHEWLEKRDRCLMEGLAKLSEEDRNFILQYYQGEKAEKIANRQRMMLEHELSPQAIRVKAHRIRVRLLGYFQLCCEPGDLGSERCCSSSRKEFLPSLKK